MLVSVRLDTVEMGLLIVLRWIFVSHQIHVMQTPSVRRQVLVKQRVLVLLATLVLVSSVLRSISARQPIHVIEQRQCALKQVLEQLHVNVKMVILVMDILALRSMLVILPHVMFMQHALKLHRVNFAVTVTLGIKEVVLLTHSIVDV